jgi:peptidoglycan/LPS O-acetylase OafA/YrhL
MGAFQPPHQESGSPRYLQVVDIVRGVSILSVLSLHLFQSHAVRPPACSWERECLFLASRNGLYGVFLFFVVSGFLITRMLASTSPSLYQPRFGHFYARRAGRILPLMLLTTLIGAAMVFLHPKTPGAYSYCFRSPSASFDPPFWISLWTFSFNWYRIFHQNASPSLGLHWDVLWSLSIEEQFYLFYPPLLARLGGEGRLVRFLAAVIFLAPLSAYAAFRFYGPSYLIFMNSFTPFGSIALGSLLYILSEKYRPLLGKNRGWCMGLCWGGAALMAAVYFGTFWENPVDCVYGPFAISVGVFVFLLGALHLKLFESKKFRILSLPGKVSYGAYLLHPAVLFCMAPLLWGSGAGTYYSVFILGTFGAAWISYRYYERPMNRWIRHGLGVVSPVR